MADVELVVKISEEDYKTLISINDSNLPSMIARKNLYKALRDSTPLPKEHGRLIDADWVLNKMSTTDAQPITPNEHYAWDFAETLFRNAPTIIEADKTESEV